MKRVCVLVLSVILVFAIAVPSVLAGSNPKGKPFVAINEQIIEVKGAVKTIEDDIAELTGRVENLEDVVPALSEAIAILQEQNYSIQTLLALNATDIGEIQTEISFLQGDLAYINDSIAGNSGDITALEADALAKSALILSLQSAIQMVEDNIISLDDSLSLKIEDNTALIEVLNQRLADAEAKIAVKQNMINGLCDDGSAVVEILEDGTLVCENVGGGTTSGGMEYLRVIVYSTDVYADNGYGGLTPAGGSIHLTAACPAGFIATNAGFNAGSDWDITRSHISPLQADGSAFAILDAVNQRAGLNFIVAVASCLRVGESVPAQ